jgi:hypothetical protein
MKTEIEKILHVDKNAFKRMTEAREEADTIRARARRRAEEMLALKEEEFVESSRTEIERAGSDARSRVLEIQEATDRYLERIREKKDAVTDELISSLIRKVIGH